MTKLLPLDRWKKQSIPERKTFSDDESDEEDEEAEKEEQIVLPRLKRKVQADAQKAKRHKPNPKRIPKKQEPREIPMSALPKKRSRASQFVPAWQPSGHPLAAGHISLPSANHLLEG